MSTNISLSFLVITGAFLSTEAVLANNSFSTAQTLVADNLSTQLSAVTSLTNPDLVSAQDPQTNQSSSSNLGHQLPQNNRVGTNDSNSVILPAPQSAVDSDSFNPNLLASRNTQPQVSSDLANLDLTNKISVIPAQTISEPFIEILVPPPRTQTVQIRPVSRFLPIQTRTTPKVVAMPTVQPLRTNAVPSQPATTYPATSQPVAAINNSASQSTASSIYPLLNPAPITSRFGWRTHPLTGSRRFHSGVDIGAPSGAPVVATANGTVVSAGWNGGYGKAVIIQHNGVQQTLYGHLSEISVQAGQVITQGTVIGLVGSTGNSTGPHLHFENRTSTGGTWTAVDPSTDIQYAVENLRRSMPFAHRDLPPGYN
jgi:murein DD-endopeptidase MepM/ murein hydrolase activator NlpD